MSVNESPRSQTHWNAFASAIRSISAFPKGVQAGQERNIEVDLAPETRRRFSDAEVRYRRAYMSPSGGGNTTPTQVTRAPGDSSPSSTSDANSGTQPVHRRRVAVNEDGTAIASPDPQQ